MIVIEDKTKCVGCYACQSICPVNAISMEYDEEGFLYPIINNEKCIDCGKCDNVCHMKTNTQRNSDFLPKYYAGYHRDESELKTVSSGGAFWAFTQHIIRLGGIVFGAVHSSLYDIQHKGMDNIDDAQLIKRSKYLQSHINNTFIEAKEYLQKGKIVLFSGTACQIAGLYSYLGQEYDNLFTCEVVCHGVPSMKAFESYIKSIENKHSSKVISIVYRNKDHGWINNHIEICFENGDKIHEPSSKNLLHGTYLRGFMYRPSCGTCKYASLPRTSDIVLADYWKYSGKLKEANNDMGISLIVCSNKHGKSLLDSCADYLYFEPTESTAAIESCYHLTHTPRENVKREEFFSILNEHGYEEAVRHCRNI